MYLTISLTEPTDTVMEVRGRRIAPEYPLTELRRHCDFGALVTIPAYGLTG